MLSKLSQRLLHTREQCRRLRSRLENTCVAMTTPSAMAGRSANKTKSTIASLEKKQKRKRLVALR